MLGILTDLADGFAPLIEKITVVTEKWSAFSQAVRESEGPLHDFGSFLTGSLFVWLEILWSKLAEAPAQLGGFANWVVEGIDPLKRLVNWIGNAVDALGDLWDKMKSLGSFGGIGGFIGKLSPFSALPAPLASGAPVIAAGTQAARVAPSAAAMGSAPLTVNVNIHGNVGDPSQVGKRVVSALEAFVRTNGHRRVQLLTTPGP
jgi:hypothetical protein